MKSDKTMEKSSSKAEFDSVEFEKRLTNLKDTQDSIQALSAWCLQNRSHHKKIVTSWLVVLKQGKSLQLRYSCHSPAPLSTSPLM